jgi:sn-glycerol 3-phosphate transport system substrate-binding protein
MPTRMLSVLLALALLGCADTDGSPDSSSPPSSAAPGSSAGETTVPPPTTVTDSGASDTSTPPIQAGRCADAPPANGATVTLWHPFSEQAAAVFEGLVADLTEERPDLVVDVVAIPGYDQLVTRLREVPSDDLPDLIIGGVNHITALLDSGVTVDPAECAATDGTALWDDLLPLAEATFTVDGRLVGVPYNVSTPVLVFDAARFRAAGLDPDSPPRRPDELRAATEVMLSSGAAAAGLALYDAATSWLVEQWSAQDGRVLAIPDNGWGVDAVERFVFDTPENVASAGVVAADARRRSDRLVRCQRVRVRRPAGPGG